MFYHTSILCDFVATDHCFFTRFIRWSLIFMHFMSTVQIVCLLDITDSDLEVDIGDNVILYALARIWVWIVSSFITQVIVFGTCYLLRYKEDGIVDVLAYQNYKGFQKQLRKAKCYRFIIFYIVMLVFFWSSYWYIVNFSLNHSNAIAQAWIILSLICMLIDFIVVDFLLIFTQLWVQGISDKYERKIVRLRRLKVARQFD